MPDSLLYNLHHAVSPNRLLVNRPMFWQVEQNYTLGGHLLARLCAFNHQISVGAH